MAKRNPRRKGQATVEFVLVLTMIMAFVFFNLQFALVSAYGSFVQYATFMAGRAYFAGSTSENTQREKARQVLVSMLKRSEGMSGADRWPIIGRGVGGDDIVKGAEIGRGPAADKLGRDSSWMEGVRYTFKSRLFYFWFSGTGGDSGRSDANFLTLTSESWLGREPSYESCMRVMSDRGSLVMDNGC